MRKKVFFAAVASVLLFTSCENSSIYLQNVEEQMSGVSSAENEKIKLEELKDNLRECNETYVAQNVNTETRGFFGKLFKMLLNFVVADASGAIKAVVNGENIFKTATAASVGTVGGTVKAIAQEVLNAPATTRGTVTVSYKFIPALNLVNTEQFALEDIVPVSLNGYSTDMDSVGYYHNKVVLSLFKEKNDALYWANLSADSIEIKIQEKMEKEQIYYRVALDTVSTNVQERLDFYDKLSANLELYEDPLEYCNSISDIDPKMSDLLSVLYIYIEGLDKVMTNEEWTSYTNEMFKVVDESGVSDAMKKNIRMSLTVALASSRLWNTKDL